MKKQKGFSLIELLIVVAIILIIAAIAIPNLLRARMAANEAAAASTIRTLNTAQVSYSIAYPAVGYAADLTALGGAAPCTATSSAACLIDNNLANATAAPGKSGYIYLMTGTQSTFVGSAVPVSKGSTGSKSFCSVEDAVLRVDTDGGSALTAYNTCQGTAGSQN